MEAQRQISNEELLALIRKAFEQDEVAEFLCGEKGYGCPVNRFVPAHVPTDFDRIVKMGVYKLYEETKSEEVACKLRSAIESLTVKDAVHIWIAYEVCFGLFRDEKRGKSVFNTDIIDFDLITKLRERILKHENALRICREWQGFSQKDGLWSDITRQDGILFSDYGEGIL